MSYPTKKVVFIGSKQTGKTKYVRQLLGLPTLTYIPTLGVEVHPYQIKDEQGNMKAKINIWDCAGDPRYLGIQDAYLLQTDLAIVFSENYIAKVQQKGIPYVLFDSLKTIEEHCVFIL